MVSTNLRFPTEQEQRLFEAVKKSAKNNKRSMNNEILRAIEFYLKNAPDAQYEVKEVKKSTPPKS